MPIVQRRSRVVYGAGPDHDDQAVVLAVQDPGDLLAAAGHGGRAALAQRQLLEEDGGRQKGAELLYAEITGSVHGLRSRPPLCLRKPRSRAVLSVWQTLHSGGRPGKASS